MADHPIDIDYDRGVLRATPYTGVTYVVKQAMELGYHDGHPEWSDLGQGHPEVGEIRGAPPRVDSVTLEIEDHAYSPLGGVPELREAVAAHYNRLYRQGKDSQYSAANVLITQGGRLALSRAMAALGPVNVGYQLPDYTVYEDMFDLHLARFAPTPIRVAEVDGFCLTAAQLEAEVVDRGLSAFVLSNPCNPTGNVVDGVELAAMVRIARDHRVTMLLDEFYSHFVYDDFADGDAATAAEEPVSAADYVEDVGRDPVLLFDGLTKGFRYPGWRLSWVVGPQYMVDSIASTARAIDGGPSRWSQRAAIEALEPERADLETTALRRRFVDKRNVMVGRLEAMGLHFAHRCAGTFYCWASLKDLPPPLDDAQYFFRRALERKVITVPGEFFDIDPGGRRPGPSPYAQWMRFSFGPAMEEVVAGLDRLEAMIKDAG